MSAGTDRVEIVHANFLDRVARVDLPDIDGTRDLQRTGLKPHELVDIFHAQVLTRQLDRIARVLQARGEGFYTIGASGHEGSAAVAWALRPDDMAFLHYRDAAFQIARSRKCPGGTPLWDMLLGFTASSEDPISGGRHKVLGSKALSIPPQTSTIASHLPKALGAAFSLGLARRIKPLHQQIPDNGLILCSFGDASLNHATAQGAINSACWTAFQNTPLPLIFLCEDNRIGISTKTPDGWVEASVSARPGLVYFRCNGLDVLDTFAVMSKAAGFVRRARKPAFVHMQCVRLYGHAGADAQTAYMSRTEIEADEAQDPLLYTAHHLIREDILSPQAICALYHSIEKQVRRVAEQAITRPKLQTGSDVMASLVPPAREAAPPRLHQPEKRESVFGSSDCRAMGQPQNMAKLINFTLCDLMLDYDEIILAGEDIGRKGGVYGVTKKLQKRFGPGRVIDTLLDEQTILGLAIGMAHNGLLPIVEIQFLAYLHNAIDQLRGEAATLPFFSNGQFTNPMVVRIAGLGYQKGFGGHFHNENTVAALRDIPGLILACPSNGLDAVLMMRECVRLAREQQRLVVFLEPIALYMIRDLHHIGDDAWSFTYPASSENQANIFGKVGVHGDGRDFAIITFGNGARLSRQAQAILHEKHGIAGRVIDLRWLAPLPVQSLLRAVRPCQHVLIVDECREQGSHSEALVTLLLEKHRIQAQRLTGRDCFIATGPAYGAGLPNSKQIIKTVLAMTRQ